jgi:hypothetical protein
MGAAWAWVALNVGYLLSTVHFMHRRLLVGEKWHWYASDLAMPLGAAFAAAAICRWAIPAGLGKVGELIALSLASASVLLAALLAAPLIREQACRQVLSFLNPSEPSTR